ncbi:MAG: thioredoxin-disulfide reductase [Deltaproteobacteria bacterium]|nr:thioredoxin-disulfide reductase [Deltaproteobacteria bacterium]
MHDLIIIGGGPAGLTAGIYAKRAMLDVILIERELVGGQIALSDVIENYPGYASISGMELMAKFEEQAKAQGLEIKFAEVSSIKLDGKVKVLSTSEGEMRTKAVILATGAKPKRIGVPGENELIGKGVSYCATCDGPFFKKQKVTVIGGGDTAVKEAVYLSKIASHVDLIHRRDSLRAEKVLQEKAFKTANIKIHWNSILKEIKGTSKVDAVIVENVKDSSKTEIPTDGVFVFVGINPATGFVDLKKDASGFIITNQNMETSVEGIYAAGDCRNTPLLQVATAVGDGAIAAFIAEKYIEDFE